MKGDCLIKKINKILSTVLAACILFTAVPVNALSVQNDDSATETTEQVIDPIIENSSEENNSSEISSETVDTVEHPLIQDNVSSMSDETEIPNNENLISPQSKKIISSSNAEENSVTKMPNYPDSYNLEDITVNTRCENTSACYQVPRSLNEEHINGYKFSDIRENKGELGTSSMLDRYPYACTLTLNNNYWVEYFNNTLKRNGINKGTHYLSDKTKTVSMTLLYNAETGYWNYDTDTLYVYVTEIAPQVTYKIIREYYIGDTKIATITSGSKTGKAGDIINGSILNEKNPSWKIRSIDGNKYEFIYEQSSPEELVLSEGSENTITLKYVARSTILLKRFESISSIDIPTDFYMEYYYDDEETYKYTLKLKDATKIEDNLYEWEVLLPINTNITFKEYNYQVERYEYIGIDGNLNVVKKDHTIPSITFNLPSGNTSSTSSVNNNSVNEDGSVSSSATTIVYPPITITNYYNYAAITVPYRVEWYDKLGNVLKETSYRTGLEGETATPTNEDYIIDGWIFDETDNRNILSKELKENEENVLKLYFYKPVVNLHFTKTIDGDAISFEKMKLKENDSYKFPITLTNKETGNIIKGILDSKNGLQINDIPIGTYVIKETDDMYFDFESMESLNSVEGVAFEKDENSSNYILTILESTLEKRDLEIKINNEIEPDRYYDDKEEKINLFNFDEIESKQITVKWIDGTNNNFIKMETIDEGSNIQESQYPTPPDYEGYEFTDWSEPSPIVDDVITIIANYREIPITETITVSWYSWEGNLIKQEVIDKGASSSFGGTPPARPDDENFTYTFKEWQVMENTDESISYIATYTPNPINSGSGNTENPVPIPSS